MSKSESEDNGKHRGTTGGPLDIRAEDVLPSDISDGQLKGNSGTAGLDADALSPLDVTSEAVRQKTDSYVLKTDLEDADIRNSTPGAHEQD
jgi:hypothetical protein